MDGSAKMSSAADMQLKLNYFIAYWSNFCNCLVVIASIYAFSLMTGFGSASPKVRYSEGPLFRSLCAEACA